MKLIFFSTEVPVVRFDDISSSCSTEEAEGEVFFCFVLFCFVLFCFVLLISFIK